MRIISLYHSSPGPKHDAVVPLQAATKTNLDSHTNESEGFDHLNRVFLRCYWKTKQLGPHVVMRCNITVILWKISQTYETLTNSFGKAVCACEKFPSIFSTASWLWYDRSILQTIVQSCSIALLKVPKKRKLIFLSYEAENLQEHL